MKRFVAVTLIALSACTKPANTETTTNTLVADSLAMDSTYGSIQTLTPIETVVPNEQEEQRVGISYAWYEVYEIPPQFEPFEKIYTDVKQLIALNDSLYYKEGAMTQADSTVFNEASDKVYQSILAYADRLKSGIKVEKGKTTPRPDTTIRRYDESFGRLPVSSSKTLDNADFMFMGGAPFFNQDADLYKDPNGNPEAHYTIDVAQNGLYFFNYIYSRNTGPIDVSYGPSLYQYDKPKFQVNGIGSITHHLNQRIPVWFLTTAGAIHASLISVNMKLTDEYGCVSSFPYYVFGCPKNIDPRSIMGVFYSDSPLSMENASSIYDRNNPLWSFDIDGDSQPDIVRIQSVKSGASSDELGVAIWYARVNDRWIVLDFASEPDCT